MPAASERHAQIRDTAFGMLALLEKRRVHGQIESAVNEPPTRRNHGAVRMRRGSRPATSRTDWRTGCGKDCSSRADSSVVLRARQGLPEAECRRAAQGAIFYVQRELENAGDSHNPTIVLCDRGTLDGLAYWPSPADEFWTTLGTTRSEQLARYNAVIHLRTPALDHGYNRQNPLRTESAVAAAEIDDRILRAWEGHPRRFVVESTVEFLDKAAEALDILRREMPECCRRHVVPALDARPTASERPVG